MVLGTCSVQYINFSCLTRPAWNVYYVDKSFKKYFSVQVIVI